MCNCLHPRDYPWIEVHNIPESGIAYKITRRITVAAMENYEIEESLYRGISVLLNKRYVWDASWSSEGDGFTCFLSLAAARRHVKKAIRRTAKWTERSILHIHLIRYTGGLGERFEPDPAIYNNVAIVKEFEYGPIVE